MRANGLLGCLLIGCAFLGFMFQGGTQYEPPLNFLKGVPESRIREAEFYPNGEIKSYRLHIYKVEMPLDQPIATARRELSRSQWDEVHPVVNRLSMYERAGVFELYGRHLNIRRFREPGTMVESQTWLSITVSESVPVPNRIQAAWRWLMRTPGPKPRR